MHDDNPEGFLDALEGQSNWSLMGPKLWWMLVARDVLRIWPSSAAIRQQLAQRRAVLHEELRIRIARQYLAGVR